MLGAGTIAFAQSNENSIRIDQAIQDLRNPVASDANGATRNVGSFVNFHAGKENTKGSRYMFPDWVNGVITTKAGVVIAKDSLLYNYDKISHDLYLTDQKTVVQVDGENIKAFTLTSQGHPMTFVRLESVRPNAFFQQLVDPGTSGYGLYKLVSTTFKKADYHSDGLVETGNNFDEFVDNDEYYIALPGGKEFKKVELRKKSIRETLSSVKPKVDGFFNSHRGDDLNESLLAALVRSLNS